MNESSEAVFSYIPNTAETSFYGMVEAAQDFLNQRKNDYILKNRNKLTKDSLQALLEVKIRTEKVAIKDAKLRTFITEDSSRDDLVAHVYDVTYGVIKPTDNLVIIDDSIVRGIMAMAPIQTIRESIEKAGTPCVAWRMITLPVPQQAAEAMINPKPAAVISPPCCEPIIAIPKAATNSPAR